MEPSPLTQQARPDSFQPKIVQLYNTLFKDDDEEEKSEGFWKEFFLLKPDKKSLHDLIGDLSADDLVHYQAQCRDLFTRASTCIERGNLPSDEIALDTLTVFLGGVLTKKYTNPSSDIINILAGLDQVDIVFTEFVSALDNCIRRGRSLEVQQKATEAALALTAGAYQTSLLSYFTHRDLFPSLIKYIQDSDTHARTFEPFLLLGLFANYNKFEFRNPYRLRLEDFVNETTIKKVVRGVGHACSKTRDGYVQIQDDTPEGWTVSSAMTYFGLGTLTANAKQKAPVVSPEAARARFADLPGQEAAILLGTYDFASANKLFCFNFVSTPADGKHSEKPFASFLSLTSYLSTHAHRSSRTTLYAHINLLVLRIIIEDPVLCKQLCSEDSKTTVRLCRQRLPCLPLVAGERTLTAAILDILINSINCNLRRRIDIDLYISCVSLIVRLVSFLSRSRTRLSYHWTELWRSLISLLRFLTTYASDLQSQPHIGNLLDTLVNLIALTLSAGEAFLPGPTEYDDLFYKLVEAGDTLVKFGDAYNINSRQTNSLPTLLSIRAHYDELLASQRSQSRSKNLSPTQVHGVIKSGYETLSITAKEGLDSWDKYREIDEKSTLKKAARVAVADVRALLETKR